MVAVWGTDEVVGDFCVSGTRIGQAARHHQPQALAAKGLFAERTAYPAHALITRLDSYITRY